MTCAQKESDRIRYFSSPHRSIPQSHQSFHQDNPFEDRQPSIASSETPLLSSQSPCAKPHQRPSLLMDAIANKSFNAQTRANGEVQQTLHQLSTRLWIGSGYQSQSHLSCELFFFRTIFLNPSSWKDDIVWMDGSGACLLSSWVWCLKTNRVETLDRALLRLSGLDSKSEFCRITVTMTERKETDGVLQAFDPIHFRAGRRVTCETLYLD